MIRVYVPADAMAVAVGADAVAGALAAEAAAQDIDVRIIRTGSRGLAWLEPLVEVDVNGVRTGYGPVRAEDVPALVAAGLLEGKPAACWIGEVDAYPWMLQQRRITFARCGVIDPVSLPDYRRHGGLAGINRARLAGPAATIAAVTASGLRGRGGAGFPAGVKWKAAAHAAGQDKFVVCNADEGDSGTFADRMIMEGDPLALIEGMAIAAFAIGAAKGFIYCRSEYGLAVRRLLQALEAAPVLGLTGDHFGIELRVGAGAYVCGEETALLESIEGKRGQVRAKPPLPVHEGLFGKPTVVNNVLTLATVPWILAHGGEAYAKTGVGQSRGTMPVQLSGNVKRPGLFEIPFGKTLGEIVDEIGGGTASGRPVRAVQCGGPLGAYWPRALFDTVYDFEAFAARDGLIGHGGIVVFDDTVDMAAQARFAMAFCAEESCGKCTPCRIGSVRGMDVIDRIVRGERRAENVKLLEDLCRTMKMGSLCALGGFVPYPVLSALRYFPEDFARDGLQAAE